MLSLEFIFCLFLALQILVVWFVRDTCSGGGGDCSANAAVEEEETSSGCCCGDNDDDDDDDDDDDGQVSTSAGSVANNSGS